MKVGLPVFIGFVAALLPAGCGSYGLLDVVTGNPELDPIHRIVEEKLAEERRDMTGSERWARQSKRDYQSDEDVRLGRERADTRRRRLEEARRLVEAGPLTLEKCLAFALEFNDTVGASRAAIRAEAGEAMFVRSRFLPEFHYYVENKKFGSGAGQGQSIDHYFRLSQTLVEFGRENPEDVTVRESERRALFEYEDVVSSVLSGVRKKLFTVLLRRQQIVERKKLLAEFQARYEKMRALEAVRRVLEVDVLTARLNVLNEEARINALEGEELRQKIDLLHLVGLPVEMTEIELRGELENFTLGLSNSLAIGLRRSTPIAQARAEMAERARVAREVAWKRGLELLARAGATTETGAAGLEIKSTEGVFALSTFVEQHLQDSVDAWVSDNNLLMDDLSNPIKSGWAAELELKIPIFDGLKRRGEYARERARLVQALHSVRDAVDTVEADIRKAYQTMLERRKDLEILKETVNISKERLRVQERLKELGKITDNELETFRGRFFSDQDTFFRKQISLMEAQENLRRKMRFFEPLPRKEREASESSE